MKKKYDKTKTELANTEMDHIFYGERSDGPNLTSQVNNNQIALVTRDARKKENTLDEFEEKD